MELNRRGFLFGTLGAGVSLVLFSRSMEAVAQLAKVVLGTATPGGGFPVYAAALIEAVRTVDPDLVIEARNTKGSAENMPMLERGKLDLGSSRVRSCIRPPQGSAAPLRA